MNSTQELPTEERTPWLPEELRAQLLETARRTLAARLCGAPRPELDEPACEARGVFVTLRSHGQLRGCMGYVLPREPLFEAVRRLVISAAQDQRFEPVRREEVEDLDIEISVLSPLVPVDNPEQIIIPRDGLVIRADGRSGLLLPQVASERGWSVARFLRETCRKAGLAEKRWQQPGAEILRFTCCVFGEPPRA